MSKYARIKYKISQRQYSQRSVHFADSSDPHYCSRLGGRATERSPDVLAQERSYTKSIGSAPSAKLFIIETCF